jgi:hypothetical protein
MWQVNQFNYTVDEGKLGVQVHNRVQNSLSQPSQYGVGEGKMARLDIMFW